MDNERRRDEGVGFAQGFRDVVRYVGVVLLVGAAMATAFTLWTPASVLPRSAARQIARAMATRVGRSATSMPPTVTPIAREHIGIVAGHSENDSGAVCPDGLTEVEINQNVAKQVKLRLEEAGFAVDLLSEFDDRLEDYSARALVSIHADSCDYINEQATGFKVAGSLETQVPVESDRLS
ncbi:MAG: N-acetylmuramoyl-L-alanine amidase, partial [Anaerolineales bacterium]|nr:N-acetylmuramoyl-L-alanine amidase [Anaerolineales bacterium]